MLIAARTTKITLMEASSEIFFTLSMTTMAARAMAKSMTWTGFSGKIPYPLFYRSRSKISKSSKNDLEIRFA